MEFVRCVRVICACMLGNVDTYPCRSIRVDVVRILLCTWRMQVAVTPEETTVKALPKYPLAFTVNRRDGRMTKKSRKVCQHTLHRM